MKDPHSRITLGEIIELLTAAVKTLGPIVVKAKTNYEGFESKAKANYANIDVLD